MIRKSFLTCLVTAGALSSGWEALPASGQEPRPDVESPRATFERKYLDVGDRRGERTLLHDWPQLSRLVEWSRELEYALSTEEATLDSMTLADFRVRVDSLAVSPLPEFLVAHADTVLAVIDSMRVHLARADSSLQEVLPFLEVSDSTVANETGDERTLVTGNTAVKVPPGLRIGDADSLPLAVLEDEEETYIDRLMVAMSDLDRLVHLVRTGGPRPVEEDGSSGEPARPEPGPPRNREVDPPEP